MSDTKTEDLQLPVVHVNQRGRPEVWSQELEDYICALIVAGQSLSTICQREDMPSITTVVKWRRTRPSFAASYAQAREDQADTYADLMMGVAFDTKEDWVFNDERGRFEPNHDVVQRARLKVDTLKWIVAKLKPGTYGERIEATLKGQVNHAHLHGQLSEPIDASSMTLEQRELLRLALVPQMRKEDDA